MSGSIFTGVHDFFHSGTWHAVSLGLIALVLLFWVATVYWVNKDARRRIEQPCSCGARDAGRRDPAVPRAADLHALPAAGVPRGRARARARDPGDREPPRAARASARSAARGRAGLPRLPGVHDEAPRAVHECDRPLEPAWQVCPYCATPVAGRGAGAAGAEAPARTRTSSTQLACADRMAVERTLILAKPDAVERSLAGEIVARFERRGLRLRAARLVVASPRARRGALRRARREAVLRRARRLHHLGPDARVRARGRGRDRDGPQDDRRDEPGRRRTRARSAASSRSRCRTTSSTAPTHPSPPSARSASGSPMGWSERRGSQPRRSGPRTTPSTPTPRRPASGRWTRSPGGCGTSPSPSSTSSATSRASTSSSSAAARPTCRPCSRSRAPAGGRRHHAGAARDGPADDGRDRDRVPARRGRRGRDRAAGRELRHGRSRSTARRSGSTRSDSIPEAARLLRPGGRFVVHAHDSRSS